LARRGHTVLYAYATMVETPLATSRVSQAIPRGLNIVGVEIDGTFQ
jgi:hypothetical protein